jgi:hypothetical protein
MPKLTYALVVAAAALTIGTPATASAEAGKTMIPLLSNYKTCDFVEQNWVPATGDGRGTAYVAASGTTATVDVDLVTAEPNTHYDVRVIQLPRASIGCAPGAPGVFTGGFVTDGLGAGRTTLSGPIESGATGAWVIISRPGEYTQTPAEFYTSEFVAKF